MNLQTKYKDKIIGLICTMMPNVDIYLLNSDVAKSATNITIALKGKEKLNVQMFEELKSVLEVIDIPYKILLVDYYRCSESIKKEVLEQAILLKRAINVVTREKIEEVTDKLVKVYRPLEIYLFGSYVWGNPTRASDLDLLIVVEQSGEKSYKRSVKGSQALIGVRVPTDLLVYTKKEFEELAGHVSSLCYKIKKEGELVYAVA